MRLRLIQLGLCAITYLSGSAFGDGVRPPIAKKSLAEVQPILDNLAGGKDIGRDGALRIVSQLLQDFDVETIVEFFSQQAGLKSSAKLVQEYNEDTPINKFQNLGTHNSYHIAPKPWIIEAANFIAKLYGKDIEFGDQLNYTRTPVHDQLERLGVRQFELDVFADTDGTRFLSPLLAKFLFDSYPADLDPSWKDRDFKVFHVPDFDYYTNVVTLSKALGDFKTWSSNHPTHEPIFVLLELKERHEVLGEVKLELFDERNLSALETKIVQIIGRDHLIIPDDVRGDFQTVRDAVLERGWPSLRESRGKFVFLLDSEGEIRNRYLKMGDQPSQPFMKDRIIFPSVGEGHPASAFIKANDVLEDFDMIRKRVSEGYIVRTQADVNMEDIIKEDLTRAHKAIQSGAQLISTDMPEYDAKYPRYQFTVPNLYPTT